MTALKEEVGPAPDGEDATAFEFPCSPAQRRFWILDRLQPGAPWLNIAIRWRLTGRVEPERFRQAFGALLARHEILRTGFVESDGTPRQRVLPRTAVELPVIDLGAVAEPQREADATRITLDLACRPFDLETPPLIRVALLRLDETEWRILVTLHHIVADGWSIGLIVQDLADLYERALDPGLPPLPVPELQYADIALWQAQQPKPSPDTGRDYWAAQLKDLEPFELLTDHPRPPLRQGRAAIATRLLPAPLTASGQRWARDQGTSFFTLSLTALAATLHRFGANRDVVIGTQVAGRSRPEMEPIIGPFINTLVLRVEAGDDPAFATLFERAREAVEGALAHAETPFEEVVALARPARSGGHSTPLFQINFIHQRSFVPDQRRSAFQILDMPSLSPGAPYDLNFFMVERGEGWRLSCEYDADLYDAETVDRLLALFESVLDAGTAEPGQRIGDLATVSPADRARIAGWNRTEAPIPGDSLPALIAAQAARTPDAIAVASGDDRLSYAALDRRANRLARLLIGRGVQPGDRVGICLERSVQLPVALLAILKAGATYVPIDPDYPALRLAQMVEDAGLAALVTQTQLATLVPGGDAARILLDAEEPALSSLPERCPERGRRPQDIAYLLFTSGSTGRPKGVEIPDTALLNLLAAMRRNPGIEGHDVLVAVTSVSFDIAALELFLPLVAGARLVIATRAETRDGSDLAALLRRSGATVLQATPATFQMLLESGWSGSQRLKLLCGGEALPRALAAKLLPHGTLWNMYGPTETTIWSAALAVKDGTTTVPVGGPIANTRFEVLDQHLRRVPLGAPGELMIGGAGLARGYLGNPDLTAERFVRPADPDLGTRLYRTGDLVRWRSDGTLDFLGRLDQQVKLRGHRIELGDVEAALAADPCVAAVAATLQQGPEGDDRLVAFVVPAEPALPAAMLTERLRQRAESSLPGYMRPAAILTLAALPLTPNGKVDRRGLKESARLPMAEAASAALEAPERRLEAIWRELLGPVDIAGDADFFDQGGDSLSAARLTARLRTTFGVTVSLSTLFEDARFGRIARLVGIRPAASPPADAEDPAVVVMNRDGSRQPLWGMATPTIFRKLAERLALDRPFQVIRPPDDQIDAVLGCETLEQIAAYYLGVLRRHQPAGPYALLGFCSDAAVVYEMARHLEAAGETVELLVLIDGWAPGYSHRLGPVLGTLADLQYKAMRFAGMLASMGLGLVRAIRTGDPHQVTARLPQADPAFGATATWRMRLHTTACARQARPAPYGGRALVVRAKVQPSGLLLDRQLGWRALVLGGTRLVTVPGDHLGIFFEPSVDLLAAALNDFARAGPVTVGTP
jgi:amino acid adenylation domain-containing protein